MSLQIAAHNDYGATVRQRLTIRSPYGRHYGQGSLAPALAEPRARIGLIIPSVNRMTEPQFNHYAPEGLGIHVARGRVAGQPSRTVAELTDEIAHAAGTLADAHPDLIVFHCTHTSMKEGADGEARIINLIRKTTGIDALSTSSLVNDALRALGLRKLVVLSPYQSNDNIIDYLAAAGFTVVNDVALNCKTRPISKRSRRNAGSSSRRRTTGPMPTASS